MLATVLGAAVVLAGSQPADRQSRIQKLPLTVSVDGRPVLGTYCAETPDHVAAMAAVGMNLVLGGRDHLDPATPVGRACADNRIRVLHHLTQHIYGRPRLADTVDASSRELPVWSESGRAAASPGVVQIDDEIISYRASEPGRLLGCERGIRSTRSARHRAGTILFWPDECAREIDEVKTSPNLWGYYVLDDSPGDAISALRAMYRLVKRADPDRIVAAGYGSAGSLCNFGPGVCDLMLIYWYPVFGSGRYDPFLTGHQVQWMTAAARSQVPGMPFLGVYQAFDAAFDNPANAGRGLPTAEQVRVQMQDFVREGCAGLVAFLGSANGMPGWIERPTMHAAIRLVNEEILRTGGSVLPPESGEVRAGRAQPAGSWRRPRPVAGIPPVWNAALPFADTEGKGIDSEFAPDRAIDLDAKAAGPFGAVTWEQRRSVGGVVGLTELVGSQTLTARCMAYAWCDVLSASDQQAQIRCGSDDDMVIRVNGRQVLRREHAGGVVRDEVVVPASLRRGANRVIVKVYNRSGMWAFHLRFTDSDGRPLAGLRFLPAKVR